jgi:hypothetical protein
METPFFDEWSDQGRFIDWGFILDKALQKEGQADTSLQSPVRRPGCCGIIRQNSFKLLNIQVEQGIRSMSKQLTGDVQQGRKLIVSL